MSRSTGRLYVPADFDTKRKNPLQHECAEKGLKQRAFEDFINLRSSFSVCSIITCLVVVACVG
jgi:hypothetical protein